MIGAFSISASGLNAASRTFAVSASNTVNASTRAPAGPSGSATGDDGVHRPRRTQQTSLPGGGVRALAVPVVPATRRVADRSSPTGVAIRPNTDLMKEVVTQEVAAANYRANAAVLRSQLLVGTLRLNNTIAAKRVTANV